MKKVLLVLACVAILVAFGTSCNKACTCKSYVLGVLVAGSSQEREVEDGKKCADYSDYDESLDTGIKCK